MFIYVPRQKGSLQVIAEHLYQQGNFTVGDTFVQEAGISNAAALKKPYTAMHAVLEQVCDFHLHHLNDITEGPGVQ